MALAWFTCGTPERPLLVARQRGDKNDLLWYSGYGLVDFDLKLFVKTGECEGRGFKALKTVAGKRLFAACLFVAPQDGCQTWTGRLLNGQCSGGLLALISAPTIVVA